MEKNTCHCGASRLPFGGHRRRVPVQRLVIQVNDRLNLSYSPSDDARTNEMVIYLPYFEDDSD